MKTDLLRIISILILAFLVIARGGVAGAAWQTVQPSALHLPDAPTQGSTTRVSVASDGSQGNAYSGGASVSADGRYVAFHSYASNLVSGDTNNYCETDGDNQFDDNCADVFVHNLQTGITELVSVASDGSQGNWDSFGPSISADGRYVAFHSGANNLVNGDTNVATDVFLHDRQTGVTERISVASNGSQGNGNSWGDAAISADGRYVAFESYASNLVSGDTNGRDDVFVHEQQTNITTRVSVASDGSQGNLDSWSPSVSANGRFVAFESNANNLVIGDINGRDAFVHDRQTGITQRVSVASDGSQGDSESWIPSISADGRYVAFESWATNLVSGDTNASKDVFVHDRQTGTTQRVSVASDSSQGNSDSLFPSISADGRYVAFSSIASNLVSGDTNASSDIFVHDQQTGTTMRISLANDSSQGNDRSDYVSISADGRHVAFDSLASNLVNGDTNNFCDTDGDSQFDDNCPDVFVYDREDGSTLIYLPMIVK